MAVDPQHVGPGSVRGPGREDHFDDPTEDISPDPSVGTAGTASGADVPRGDAGSDEPDAFEPGRVLCGRYELERVAGRGGFCVVLGARDRRREAAGDDDARVAVKVLRPELRGDDEARSRLTAEFRQLQRLSHPNIVRVFDLDRQGQDWFVVMELLEGVSLAGLINHCEGGRVPARRALAIVTACAEALAYAHSRGVVHGDVKPGNVFVGRDDGVRLLDFGVASPERPLTGAGRTGGSAFATPAYASPQVLEGGVPGVADDLYSLGCVAFELLSGVHPFGRMDARQARAEGLRPDDVPTLAAPVREALQAALSFDPARRPGDMQAFIALLEPGESMAEAATPVPPPVAAGDRPAGGRRGRWIAAGVLLVAVVAILLRAFGDGPDGSPASSRPAEPASDLSRPAIPDGAGDPVPAVEPSPGVVEGMAGEAAPEAGAARGPTRPAQVDRPVPQRVGFERSTVLVSRSAPAAAVPLRRTGGGAGRAVVTWRIAEGSALTGRDFAGPLSGVLVMADGQELATVFVPLLDPAGAADDRDFSVVIETVGGAAAKGESDRVDVTLRSFVRGQP